MNNQEEEKKRNATVYEKIAKLFGKKEHYVRSIMKIGKVNPLYFERLESGRISPFQAYNECLKEEKRKNGTIPLSEVPKVSEPVYFGNEVLLPDYDTETATQNAPMENEAAMEQAFNNLNITVTAAPQSLDDTPVQPAIEQAGTKSIRCKCPVCDADIEVIINNQ